jgi:hypothetical protein
MAQGPAAQEEKPWQTDFDVFLGYMEDAEAANPLDLDALAARLVDRKVVWRGTIKYVLRGRPYIRESFVPVDASTRLSRVMYFVDAEDIEAWEGFERGDVLGYSGVVSAVKVETIITDVPFVFIELREVRPRGSVGRQGREDE